VRERGHDRVGDRADARLQAGAVGMRSATKPAMVWSSRPSAGGGTSASGWSLPHVTGDLADVDLVAAERARHLRVDFEEEPGTADEAAGVVGTDAEAEVAVTVGRRGGGDHQRVVGAARMWSNTSLKWLGTRSTCARLVARPGDVRQEVRDVPQSVAVLAVQVRAVAQRVHLVHGDAVEMSPRAAAASIASSSIGWARRWRAARSGRCGGGCVRGWRRRRPTGRVRGRSVCDPVS
jgi:hypothetical protein